jgi:hypothetical protein
MEAKFELGKTVMTPGAIDVMRKKCAAVDDGFAKMDEHTQNFVASVAYAPLLRRHQSGDYGEIGKEDCKANDYDIDHDGHIVSKYKVGDADVYVITEHDRSVTTILLPDEY